jgi:hypothetical protein
MPPGQGSVVADLSCSSSTPSASRMEMLYRWRSSVLRPKSPRDGKSHPPQASSASRRAASLAGFFILSQYGDRPET